MTEHDRSAWLSCYMIHLPPGKNKRAIQTMIPQLPCHALLDAFRPPVPAVLRFFF